ncbi:hypothetical protein [Granulicatella sp. 20925_1_45]|uniref:hypothetical protein n=1 Tax=Granulicatella sp. 20925_1_45 TaxID=3003685 RepID=UPI00352C005C
MVLIKWVVADVIANALEGNGRGGVLLEEVGAKKAFFIGFNRFFILHMGVKRSTIRVSTLKEMKLCLR